MRPCTCVSGCKSLMLPKEVFCKESATAEEIGHPPIVWCDLETTGLDPSWDQLLEVCFIVTDADLHPSGVYQAVIRWPELVSMSPVVTKMHTDSLLLDTVHSGEAKDLWTVQHEVIDFFERNGVNDKSPLAGSTIHFDRGFLRTYLPVAHAALHYRNIDVSSLRELIKRWAPAELYTKGDAHRATPDCFDSIAQLRHYRKVMSL